MLLGHVAVGLAGRRLAPAASLPVWLAAVLFVDLLWPFFLLAGLEQVRIVPGITAFTPLDFTHYPITHSLVGGAAWAILFAGGWLAWRRSRLRMPPAGVTTVLLAGGVMSHWVLDVITHRPDMPVLPGGPYLGMGLWNSIPATIVVELSMTAAALIYLARAAPALTRRWSFRSMMILLLLIYLGAAFGPPPPDPSTVAVAALALWLLVPWSWWAERGTSGRSARR